MRWALCCEKATGAGDADGGANSRGRAGVCGDDWLSRHPLVVEVKRQLLSQRKKNAFTGG